MTSTHWRIKSQLSPPLLGHRCLSNVWKRLTSPLWTRTTCGAWTRSSRRWSRRIWAATWKARPSTKSPDDKRQPIIMKTQLLGTFLPGRELKWHCTRNRSCRSSRIICRRASSRIRICRWRMCPCTRLSRSCSGSLSSRATAKICQLTWINCGWSKLQFWWLALFGVPANTWLFRFVESWPGGCQLWNFWYEVDFEFSTNLFADLF